MDYTVAGEDFEGVGSWWETGELGTGIAGFEPIRVGAMRYLNVRPLRVFGERHAAKHQEVGFLMGFPLFVCKILYSR
jgi:hypothetical protein